MSLSDFECYLLDDVYGIQKNGQRHAENDASCFVQFPFEQSVEEVLSICSSLQGEGCWEEKRKLFRIELSKAVTRLNVESVQSLLLHGIAALVCFVRNNLLGPQGSEEERSVSPSILSLDGEDVIGRLKSPDLLLLARIILLDPLDVSSKSSIDLSPSQKLHIGGLELELESLKEPDLCMLDAVSEIYPSWLWWAGRVAFMHQKCLKHNSETIRTELIALQDQMMRKFFNEDSQSKLLDVSHTARLYVELAQWQLQYRRVQAAEDFVTKAEQILRIKVEVSGALGTRTVHQVEPKAQLLAQVTRQDNSSLCPEERGDEVDFLLGESISKDVLLRPKWIDGRTVSQLSLIEQCIVLAKSDLIDLGTGKDDLKSWEMEPYTQLVQSQAKSTFPLQVQSALSRVHHEKERNRTRERAYTLMEQLVEMVRNRPRSENVPELHWSLFCLRFPTIIQLRSELSEFQIALGDVSPAIATYEELELWDELVLCYRLLQKTSLADDLVSRRLESNPCNPSLLCTLGDLRSSPALYYKAWEVSQQKYPRAQRSLGRFWLSKEDFKSASEAFELALGINTLHPHIWFSLGYCYLKLDQDEEALRAFTRCAQLEPENGEAWNNLAALWIRRQKPERALWALKEAIKHKHNSWETWENYARTSLACREFSLTIRGLDKVLSISDGKRLKSEILVPLVNGVLEKNPNKENQKMIAKLIDVLQKASGNQAWNHEFWILLAKLHSWRNDIPSSRESLKKGFRQLHGSQWKSDLELFRLLISVLQQLVESYKEGEASSGEVASLNLQLKGIVKQAQDSYEGTEDLAQLETVHKEMSLL